MIVKGFMNVCQDYQIVNPYSLSFEHIVDSVMIPNLFSVKTLFLRKISFLSNMQPLLSYTTTLHRLHLIFCPISDVSMLGSIPFLEIKFCDELIDISPLQNNDQIVIEECKLIRDFSQSFTNSRRIEIVVSGLDSSFSFDLTRWKRVEDLSLADTYDEFYLPTASKRYTIPDSVKILNLSGTFLLCVNFMVTAQHSLHDITLVNNNFITSLEDYGLERVAFIELEVLGSLQSLEGLGRGRNRKISISDCNAITDFSPICHVPIVEITYCEGFTDLMQLRFVEDLRIKLCRDLSFRPHSRNCLNPYENIHFLGLSGEKYLRAFDGLEKIPYLQFNFNACGLIKRFLDDGNQLENQRIVFVASIRSFNELELQEFHQCYLNKYYCYESFQNQRIWSRR